METWKIRKKSQSHRQKGRSKWPIRLVGILLLLVTVGATVMDFPVIWNQGTGYVEAKTGWNIPDLNANPYRLGLDLQGGTHLVYEADMSQIPNEDRDSALQGVRDVIERRVNAFGVSEPVVETTSTGGTYRVIVELAGVLDVTEAIKQIGETPILEFKEEGAQLDHEPTADEQAQLAAKQETDRATANDVLAQAKRGEALQWEEVDNVTADSDLYGPIAKAIADNRVGPGGIVPVTVETSEGLNIVKVEEVKDSKEMLLSHLLICFEGKTACESPISEIEASIRISDLKKQATPENFAQLANENSTDKTPDGDLGWISPGDTVPAFELAAAALPVGGISDSVETEFGYHLIYKRDERPITAYKIQRVVSPLSDIYDIVPPSSPWKNTELSGKQLTRATVQFDNNAGGKPLVSLQFNSEGADLFADITSRNVGKPVAIFLDGQAISVPTVQQAIYGGQAVIQGNFTLDEAKLLAQRLNAGALPVPVQLLSQETVGPTLGLASLEKSVLAALLGFLFVSLFMIVLYRLPGFFAVLALVFYAVLNLAIYQLFGVTITLAGIAGLVLSLGIAVDANVLIFERIKDEYRAGRDLMSAMDEGFKRAWPPIRDGHMTTLISAVVLYFFSSSFVKGFALTLAVGVILSLFTAIVVARTYMKIARDWKIFRTPALNGLRRNADAS